ncbi:MAG: aminoglycoside phosphotransferase family protein [Syntrophobacteraceae bacterium]
MKIDLRHEPDLQDYLATTASHLGFSSEPPRIEPLTGDGSDRKFYRIRQGDLHVVALVSPRKKVDTTDENDSYYLIGEHLAACGLPVPRFLSADSKQGIFIMEDFGDYHMQKLVNRAVADQRSIYRRALQLLLKLHKRAPEGFRSSYCFDTPIYDPHFVYARELEYFRTAFLEDYMGIHDAADMVRSDFENIAEEAGVQKTLLLMHRDFQSRNLMVHKGSLRLLDFQGMRFGPPAYDLASLLVDPYVTLRSSVQAELFELYWSSAEKFLNCSYREFKASYRAVRLCRNLQALAAYAFLGLTKRKRFFIRYIPRAWKRLHEWINGPCRGRYPKLEKCINAVQEGRFKKEHPLKYLA